MSAGRKPFALPTAGHLLTLPPAPPFLTPRGAELWADVGGRMVDARLLAEFDLPTLANYCCALARVEECERFLAANGSTATIRDDHGTVRSIIVAPELTISIREREAARRLASELGLSPTARAKIAGRDGAQANALALLSPL